MPRRDRAVGEAREQPRVREQVTTFEGTSSSDVSGARSPSSIGRSGETSSRRLWVYSSELARTRDEPQS